MPLQSDLYGDESASMSQSSVLLSSVKFSDPDCVSNTRGTLALS